MEKITYHLGQAATLGITLNVFAKEDVQVVRGKTFDRQVLIKRYTSPDGSSYTVMVKISYYIAFNIWANKSEEYDRSNGFALGARNIFQFKIMLKEFLQKFRTEGLFKLYTQPNGSQRIVVDKSMSQKMVMTQRIGNATICLMYAVINVTKDYIDGAEDLYEGFILYVNDMQHYCQMTIDEGLYLYDILDKNNFSLLALELYRLHLEVKEKESELIEKKMMTVENPFFTEVKSTAETNEKRNGILVKPDPNAHLTNEATAIPNFN